MTSAIALSAALVLVSVICAFAWLTDRIAARFERIIGGRAGTSEAPAAMTQATPDETDALPDPTPEELTAALPLNELLRRQGQTVSAVPRGENMLAGKVTDMNDDAAR